MIAHWRNNDWKYPTAATHADSTAFRKRQEERKREAEAQAALAAVAQRAQDKHKGAT